MENIASENYYQLSYHERVGQ